MISLSINHKWPIQGQTEIRLVGYRYSGVHVLALCEQWFWQKSFVERMLRKRFWLDPLLDPRFVESTIGRSHWAWDRLIWAWFNPMFSRFPPLTGRVAHSVVQVVSCVVVIAAGNPARKRKNISGRRGLIIWPVPFASWSNCCRWGAVSICKDDTTEQIFVRWFYHYGWTAFLERTVPVGSRRDVRWTWFDGCYFLKHK